VRQNRQVKAVFRFLFATSLGVLHDDLADHRNTAIIPTSRVLSPELELASLVGVATAQR
jgi:hypothetical protein